MMRHSPRLLTACTLLSLSPWLVQCKPGPKPGSPEGKNAHPAKAEAPPAVAVSVEVRADGLGYRPGEAVPFTGESVELHPDLTPAVALRRVPYVQGKKHGSVTRWTPKGKLLEDRRYEHGVPKACTNYHSNGQKKIEIILNAHDKAEGPYYRWYDNGVLHVESGFDSEERFHGEEKIYDREGKLVGHYRNEHGKFMEVIFETPEEKERRLAHWADLEEAKKAEADGAPAPPPAEQ